ncbi:hypothetical protein IWQ61_009444 [Dispira simplex]|nr:hypothetical protein IWQ61_009444 [Dispira simplex]
MSRDNKSYEIGDAIPSRQANLKQYGLDNPRLARRGRGNNRRRRRSSSATPSPEPSPSRIRGPPITGATGFSQEHMDALHIVPVLNCPMEEVVPLNHCPDDLLRRVRAIWAMTRKDLYSGNPVRLTAAINEEVGGNSQPFDGDITWGLYSCMAAVVRLVDRYTGDDVYESVSDDEVENLSKRVTTSCADTICPIFLANFTQMNSRKFPTWYYCPVTRDTQVLPERYNFTVRPDRLIFYAQSKRQRTPFAWININPYHLAPTTEEYEATFPQIAAQTIAMARYQPREVFGIEFSHRYVTFWRALIPENYLELVKGSGDLPPNMVLTMKRSTVLDLELPDDRRQFAHAFLALLKYWNKQTSANE